MPDLGRVLCRYRVKLRAYQDTAAGSGSIDGMLGEGEEPGKYPDHDGLVVHKPDGRFFVFGRRAEPLAALPFSEVCDLEPIHAGAIGVQLK